ncbi:MAG: DUF975 family protein [Oscillospiraceae bacterium]|nr:DUF975 family protein [Oscillospiraceae bacterium]
MMMKTRQEIKQLAKSCFQSWYWPCVGSSVLCMLVISAVGGVTFWAGGLGALLLSGPITVGLCYFFLQVCQGRAGEIQVGTPFQNAFTGYGRKLGGYLWMQLFTFLWSLLFVIPGIVKAFSYAMTPYILADCPNVKAQDALKLSMRMMAGHKGELFVFYLSFIGWGILSAFTLGILAVFYVNPYLQASLAGYYLEVRDEALRTGAVTRQELEGMPLR